MTFVTNKVQLIGKICVPKIKIAESGLKVAELCVYVYEPFYDNDGEKAHELMIHSIRAYGKLAENIQEQFSKTATFSFEGILVHSSYKFRGWNMPYRHVQISSFGVFKNYPHSTECRVYK